MDYSELLKKRRAVRDYEDKEVPLDILMQIINESCLAPSSSNRQPWHFIIINNKDVIKRLSDESKRNLLLDLERNPASPSSNYEAILRDKHFNVFYNAPVPGVHCGSERAAVDSGRLCACRVLFHVLSLRQRACNLLDRSGQVYQGHGALGSHRDA